LSRSVVAGLGTVARLGLAAVFLVSGLLKAVAPAQTQIAVSAYQLLPSGLVGPVATMLPLVELALGTLLLVGAFTRWVALASVVLLVVLMTGVAQAWARGLSIDCGCFGGGGAVAEGNTRYPQELARDVGMVLLALWLLVRPQTALSVDGWLRADPARGGDQPGVLSDNRAT
jgi:uncharacterized membrane protein YphA (DoxX/SURF4 family)